MKKMEIKLIHKANWNLKPVFYRDLEPGQLFTFFSDSEYGYKVRLKTDYGHIQLKKGVNNPSHEFGDEQVIPLDGQLFYWEI